MQHYLKASNRVLAYSGLFVRANEFYAYKAKGFLQKLRQLYVVDIEEE